MTCNFCWKSCGNDWCSTKDNEMDLYTKIEKWYTNNGISLSSIYDNNSTEGYREELVEDFADRALQIDKLEKIIKKLVTSQRVADDEIQRLRMRIIELEMDVQLTKYEENGIVWSRSET